MKFSFPIELTQSFGEKYMENDKILLFSVYNLPYFLASFPSLRDTLYYKPSRLWVLPVEPSIQLQELGAIMMDTHTHQVLLCSSVSGVLQLVNTMNVIIII